MIQTCAGAKFGLDIQKFNRCLCMYTERMTPESGEIFTQSDNQLQIHQLTKSQRIITA
mgnify:FL=1